ncbi:MAG: hypothetical protein AB8H86_21965 [Polyangiales bacterium]
MRAFFVALAMLLLTSAVNAQEGASGLGAPPNAHNTPSPAAVAPASDAETPEPDATPDTEGEPATPAAGLGDVPPPPAQPAGYGSLRYEAPAPGVVTGDSPDLRIPSMTATRLRALDGSLRTLAARRGSIVDGILSITSGGLSIGLGAFVHSSDKLLASYLYLWGAAGITRGIIDLALRSRAPRLAIEFSHMPMGSLEDVETRLAFGESALEQIARRARMSRLLDASISVVTGALVLPVYFIPRGFVFDSAFDYFVLIGAGISVITGVVGLASRSDAERRWSAYRELRDRLNSDAATANSRVRIVGAGIGPTPDGRGGAATISASF